MDIQLPGPRSNALLAVVRSCIHGPHQFILKCSDILDTMVAYSCIFICVMYMWWIFCMCDQFDSRDTSTRLPVSSPSRP